MKSILDPKVDFIFKNIFGTEKFRYFNIIFKNNQKIKIVKNN